MLTQMCQFFLASGINISIQPYEHNTASDHLPLFTFIPLTCKRIGFGKLTRWNVFSLFTEYTSSFWEKNWNLDSLDSTYNYYTRFLFLLSCRCTTVFPIVKYRPSIPPELRSLLSYIRALSFKLKRKHNSVFLKEISTLKKFAKLEIKRFFTHRIYTMLQYRNSSLPIASDFWSKCKRHLKSSSSSIFAFISPNGDTVKDANGMCEIGANFYENLFKKSIIYLPHPYTDSPVPDFDNVNERIPSVTLDELLNLVINIKKKKSVDARGLNNYMFHHLSLSHWPLLLKLINKSFESAVFPSSWKESRMILIAKKDAICPPSLTRPISLIDSFLKVCEKLFLSRFRDVLFRRGLLPDIQSGFREKFRLQTRLLLFLGDLRSLLVNSAPVCTLFIDFKSAFDMLWHHGCIGKLKRLGIPHSHLNWIENWFSDRQGFIEINNCRSRWFPINKGGPQGSVLTPTLFITYHCDMYSFLAGATSHMFADDVAAIVSGQMGLRFTDQCIDLEKRLCKFLDQLEFYSVLADQPLNFSKTEAMFSCRAIANPKFNLAFPSDNSTLNWKKEYKYLGYIISRKLGWSKLIHNTEIKIRRSISLIKSFKIFGCSSPKLRLA